MCLVYIKIQSTTHNYSMVSHSSRKFDSSRQSFYCHFSVHYLPCVCVMCVIIVWSWSCAFVHILTRFWNKIVKISAAIKIQIKSMHTHRVERTITLYKQSNSNGNHPNRQNSQLTLFESLFFFITVESNLSLKVYFWIWVLYFPYVLMIAFKYSNNNNNTIDHQTNY